MPRLAASVLGDVIQVDGPVEQTDAPWCPDGSGVALWAFAVGAMRSAGRLRPLGGWWDLGAGIEQPGAGCLVVLERS